MGHLSVAEGRKKFMKKLKTDELRPEYLRRDLGKGVRGKYHDDYTSGTNLILLSPDVASVFSNDAEVNRALRELIQLARKSAHASSHSKRNS
jgi:hypothetical protein